MPDINLNLLLTYDPDTGYLYWKERYYEDFPHLKSNNVDSFNTRCANKPALRCIGSGGYYVGRVLTKQYLAHRVIWKMNNGDWPKHQIDHIDGDKLNNRLCNLREASSRENSRNFPLGCNNKTGFFGVYQIKSGKWLARIQGDNGQQVHLGYFDTLEEAAQCRKEAEMKYGYHENHGRTP